MDCRKYKVWFICTVDYYRTGMILKLMNNLYSIDTMQSMWLLPVNSKPQPILMCASLLTALSTPLKMNELLVHASTAEKQVLKDFTQYDSIHMNSEIWTKLKQCIGIQACVYLFLETGSDPVTKARVQSHDHCSLH